MANKGQLLYIVVEQRLKPGRLFMFAQEIHKSQNITPINFVSKTQNSFSTIKFIEQLKLWKFPALALTDWHTLCIVRLAK